MVWVYREEEDSEDENRELEVVRAELDICREWAEEIGHHVYCTGSVLGLEKAIEELYAVLDIVLPNGEPRLERKKGPLFEMALDLSKKGQ